VKETPEGFTLDWSGWRTWSPTSKVRRTMKGGDVIISRYFDKAYAMTQQKSFSGTWQSALDWANAYADKHGGWA